MAEQSEEYKLGLALGRFVKEQGQRHPAKLRAVIADLLVDQSLRAPLHELVELPVFLEAEPLVQSARTTVLVNVLLDELRPVFRAEILLQLQQVLQGYFCGNATLAASQTIVPSPESHTNQINHNVTNSKTSDQKETGQNSAKSQLSIEEKSLEKLKRHLENEDWDKADVETWRLLVASTGCTERGTFESIWNDVGYIATNLVTFEIPMNRFEIRFNGNTCA